MPHYVTVIMKLLGSVLRTFNSYILKVGTKMSPERFAHYKLGIKSIDDDHIHLFGIMDKLILCLKEQEVTRPIALIEEIMSFMVHHCQTERNEMIRVNYPYIKWHCDEHDKLLKKLEELVGRLYKKEYMSFYTIVDFEDSFLNHLDHEDRKFGDWVRNQGKI
jgi:hemerythrin-like metal-binding protein